MRFNENEFKTPGAAYRAAPFWSWNGKLNKGIVESQLKAFSEMGMGGYHIHSRVGLKDEYLGDTFLEYVKHCNDFGKKSDMLTWLYDEDKWPSGFGGGRVTQKKELRDRCMLFSKHRYPDGTHLASRPQPNRLTENGITTLLAAYIVEQDDDGYLTDYRRVEPEDLCANRFAYEILTDELSWFNNRSYADLLNPETTKEFIRVTHEKYYNAIGNEFSKSVPAIFTDEPQHSMSHTLSSSLADEDLVLPWSGSVDQAYKDVYGVYLLDELPLVIYSRRNIISKEKHHFHSLITQLFKQNYFGVLNAWCREHNILLSGHVMREESLIGQTMCVGECMPLYDEFGLPGLDILADDREYNTAKQVQSVVHQKGKQGAICELYGVTNWDFGFRGYRNQADWLIALGTTVRVPHLAWMYMGGESKRDYPAPLDVHSPWYKRARSLEDTLARESYICQVGKPLVRIAVIHPIESYWSIYGPNDITATRRDRLERAFEQLTDHLLFGGIDFDFIAESMLDDAGITGKKLRAGIMEYDACIVPELMTIRSETLDLLRRFADEGGKVLVLNAFPQSVDCDLTKDSSIKGAQVIAFDKYAIMDALSEEREVSFSFAYGIPSTNIIHQLRQDGDDRWLYITTARPPIYDRRTGFVKARGTPILTIGIRGNYYAECLNAENGDINSLETKTDGGFTYIKIPFYDEDSAILHFTKTPSKYPKLLERSFGKAVTVASSAQYTLSEGNAFILDMAEWSIDGDEFEPREEVLRIDNAVRTRLNMLQRSDAFPQPWLAGNKNPTEHELMLRFRFYSDINCSEIDLAYESGDWIEFNGRKQELKSEGSFVDSSINRCRIGNVIKGENTLMIHIPFGPLTDIESFFLIGSFGVRVCGDEAQMMELPTKLGFTDICSQGLPFFGGNITYSFDFTTEDGMCSLFTPLFAGSLLEITVDSGEARQGYRAPFRAVFDGLKEGKHHAKITVYGTRINQFGQLHCVPKNLYWGPKSWRTEGRDWSYAYQLKPQGLLSSVLKEELER